MESKTETWDIREFETFKVVQVDNGDKVGYQIVGGENEFPIFGLGNRNDTPAQLEKTKAFLDYWCLHLNQAFMWGFASNQGFNKFGHTEGTWKRLDDLYKKMI